MKYTKLVLTIFLLLAVLMLINENSSREFQVGDVIEDEYAEIASVLWKAHVYPDKIRFISADRVIHTRHFDIGTNHVDSSVPRQKYGNVQRIDLGPDSRRIREALAS